MRYDPRRLEATYGALRQRLEAAGLATSLPGTLDQFDGLGVARRDDPLVSSPIVAVGCVDSRWFLRVYGRPARHLAVAADGVFEAVVALVASAQPLPLRAPAVGLDGSSQDRPRQFRVDARLLDTLAVQAVDARVLHDARDLAERRHHESLGWRVLTDEVFVRSQLERFDQAFRSPPTDYRLPDPGQVWDTTAHRERPLEQRERHEDELTLAALRALRAAVRPGEHVLVLDWTSTCWQLDPHGPIADAHLDSWPRRFLGDETLYWVDPAHRFGIVTDWREMRWRAFGAPLLAALEHPLPAVLQPLAANAPTEDELEALVRREP